MEFVIPGANARPTGIATGADGNLWVAEDGANKIGVFSPAGALLHEYPLPTPFSDPQSVVAGTDGRVWFAEYGVGQLGAMDSHGNLSEYPVGDSNSPYGLAFGADGYIWYTAEPATKDPFSAVGSITLGGILRPQVRLPTHTVLDFPSGIATAADGTVWFTVSNNNFVGRLTADGTPIEYTASWLVSPDQIIAGPDRNMWFTDAGGSLGRAKSDGTLTQYPVPSGSAAGITLGPDGNLWFTENLSGKIGRFLVP